MCVCVCARARVLERHIEKAAYWCFSSPLSLLAFLCVCVSPRVWPWPRVACRFYLIYGDTSLVARDPERPTLPCFTKRVLPVSCFPEALLSLPLALLLSPCPCSCLCPQVPSLFPLITSRRRLLLSSCSASVPSSTAPEGPELSLSTSTMRGNPIEMA